MRQGTAETASARRRANGVDGEQAKQRRRRGRRTATARRRRGKGDLRGCRSSFFLPARWWLCLGPPPFFPSARPPNGSADAGTNYDSLRILLLLLLLLLFAFPFVYRTKARAGGVDSGQGLRASGKTESQRHTPLPLLGSVVVSALAVAVKETGRAFALSW